MSRRQTVYLQLHFAGYLEAVCDVCCLLSLFTTLRDQVNELLNGYRNSSSDLSF